MIIVLWGVVGHPLRKRKKMLMHESWHFVLFKIQRLFAVLDGRMSLEAMASAGFVLPLPAHAFRLGTANQKNPPGNPCGSRSAGPRPHATRDVMVPLSEEA